MLRSDSRRQEFNPDIVIGNNDSINNDMITEIEKELQDHPCEIISLVFLLYEVPITALQRLIVFERISKDNGSSSGMLHEWFQHAKHSPTWKHEFIEALLVCQLNSIVRKLGLHVPTARNHYQTDNVEAIMYLNPVKKALYKMCEKMNEDNLLTLKKTLVTYEIDTSDYDSCELILLKLMCDKFVSVNHFQYNKKTYGFHVELDKLLKIIENLPGLRQCAQELKQLQRSINGDSQPHPVIASTPAAKMKVDESNENDDRDRLYNHDLQDAFGMISALSLEDDDNFKSLKADKTNIESDCFQIKSSERIGVCVILNQIEFYPSRKSIESNQTNPLSKRNGSEKDQATLERTMKALNFKVYTAKNLNHTEIFSFLLEVIKTKVSKDDSVFMLCILSHGVKGHVIAADSVKVNMDDIQKLLDSDEAVNVHGKPKLLIIQACQVDETPLTRLVADGPLDSYALKKTNFLIYWATAPELEAYRDESQGSIFIQLLCSIIRECANREHICDIFTKVTDRVTLFCDELGCKQVPIYHTTLRKKLYLKMPQ